MTWEIIEQFDNYIYQDFLKNKNLKSFYNSFEFSLLMKSNRWTHNLIVNFNQETQIDNLANIFIKQKFIFKLIYIPGGIEGNLNNKLLNDLIQLIRNKYGNFIVIYFYLHDEERLLEIKYKKLIKIFNFHNVDTVMKKNLNLPINELSKSYTKNWRHNLNRSKKYKNVIIKQNPYPNFKEMLILYDEMTRIKKFKSYIDENLLKKYFKFFSKNIIHFEARINKKLIAFRTIIYFENSAWDLFACSNLDSKKNYATYNILNSIFSKLIEKRIYQFDLSGVDKKNNIGVYNFKKGSGGIIFKKYGEILYSPIIVFSILFSIAITVKRIFVK